MMMWAICLFATESQSDRVAESQTPKGTQYTGGWNFFVPDFNKLPKVRFQGDKSINSNEIRRKTLSPNVVHSGFAFISQQKIFKI